MYANKMADGIEDTPIPQCTYDSDFEVNKGKGRKTKTYTKTNSSSAKTINDTDMSISREEFNTLQQDIHDVKTTFTDFKDLLGPLKSFIRSNQDESDHEQDPEIDIHTEDHVVVPPSASAPPHALSPSPLPDIEPAGEDDDVYFQQSSGLIENLGDKISDKIAEGISTILKHGLDEKPWKDIHEKYKVPENCLALKVPKCDEEIFKAAHKRKRQQDFQLQKVQTDLRKGLMAVTKAYGTAADRETRRTLCNALPMLASSCHSVIVHLCIMYTVVKF